MEHESGRFPVRAQRRFRTCETKSRPSSRCKDLFNIRMTGDGQAEYAGDDLAAARAAKAPIIQWLPEGYGIPCRVLTPEGEVSGVCEPQVAGYEGRTVQFERFGFVRVDRADEAGVLCYFTHPVKEILRSFFCDLVHSDLHRARWQG